MRPTTPSVPLKLKGTGSLSSGRVDLTGDEDPTDEDGDNGMGDPTGGSVSLGGRKKSGDKYRGDEGNTRDGETIVGGAIGARSSGIGDSLLVALYAFITFIYGSSWKGEMVSEAERTLDESSKGSEEVFPGQAGE
ncbi:hypothetical protein Tco_0570892 [Tanacetum coccineum]